VNCDEGIDHEWIVHIRTTFAKNLEGLVVAETGPVGTVRRQGVKAIHDGQDPSSKRNVRPGETRWIARAIPVFMMMSDYRDDRIGKANRRQQIGSDVSVTLHLAELCLSQTPRLVQDMFGDSQLAMS